MEARVNFCDTSAGARPCANSCAARCNSWSASASSKHTRSISFVHPPRAAELPSGESRKHLVNIFQLNFIGESGANSNTGAGIGWTCCKGLLPCNKLEVLSVLRETFPQSPSYEPWKTSQHSLQIHVFHVHFIQLSPQSLGDCATSTGPDVVESRTFGFDKSTDSGAANCRPTRRTAPTNANSRRETRASILQASLMVKSWAPWQQCDSRTADRQNLGLATADSFPSCDCRVAGDHRYFVEIPNPTRAILHRALSANDCKNLCPHWNWTNPVRILANKTFCCACVKLPSMVC